jgi:endonuclease III
MCEISLNKAIEVVKRLQKAYINKEGIYKKHEDLTVKTLPRNVKPRSREHLLFLMFTTMLDYQTKSTSLFIHSKQLFETNPALFEPSFILKNFTKNDPKLINILKEKLKVRYPKEAAIRWYSLAEKLHTQFSDDPRNILKGIKSYEELRIRIHSFRGFGQKIGDLFIRFLLENGFITLENIYEIEMPIDVHDCQIAIKTGIVKVDSISTAFKHSRNFTLAVKKVLKDACKKAKAHPIIIDKALWILGSEGCGKLCNLCPLRDLCLFFD